MSILRVLLFTAIIVLSFNGCKKEEPTPAPPATTGSIKIEFSGTASPGYANTYSIYFAKDLYHLEQRIFSFSKTSTSPHSEITITDVEPQDWYYLQIISTPGAPFESKGTILVKAGQTSTIGVQLF